MSIPLTARSKKTISAVPAAPNRLRFGRKSVVLGLLWQPARRNIPLRDQAAFASGPHGEFDLFLGYGNGKQHGFASTSDGVASGMLAGATMFETERMSDAWLGVFPLGDPFPHWWVVSVRDGQIYEDRVIPDSSQASAAFGKMLEAPGWKRIIAPANWNIPSSEQAELGELISPRSAIRLRPVDRLPFLLLRTVAAALVLAVALYGWTEFQDFRNERQLQRIAADIAVPAQREIPMPWIGAPGIEPFVDACIAAMEDIWIVPAGWNPQRAECARRSSGASARIDLQKAGGGMHFVRSLAVERTGKEPNFSGNRKQASLTVDVALPGSDRRIDPVPWSRQDVESSLSDRFDQLGLGASLALRKAGHGADGESSQFGRFDIALSTSVGIREYARLLSDIPAVVPEALSFDAGSKAWKLAATAFFASPDQIPAADR